MKVRVLGASASGSGQRPYLTTFLVDDVLAVDAGSIGIAEDVATQRRVKHVVLSHAHADHTATLPLLIDNTFAPDVPPMEVFGNRFGVDSLRRDVFNDRVWPDLLRIGRDAHPFLDLRAFDDEIPLDLGHLTVTPIATTHTIPCHAFLVDDGKSAVLITSDTSPTERMWEVARAHPRLRAVFIECSFPDAEKEMALLTGHLTPGFARREIEKLDRDVQVVAYHIKPRYYDVVCSEIERRGGPVMRVADPREVYVV